MLDSQESQTVKLCECPTVSDWSTEPSSREMKTVGIWGDKKEVNSQVTYGNVNPGRNRMTLLAQTENLEI